jgi:predicted ferric reductase
VRNRRIGIGLLLLLLIVNVGIIKYFWWQTSAAAFLAGGGQSLIALGRLVGLLMTLLILGQVLMISAVGFIEQLIGFDAVTRYHRLNGIAIGILILFHPVLIVLGYSAQTGNNPLSQYLTILGWEDMLKASLALFMLFAIVIISAWRPLRKRLNYEQWFYSHLIVFIAVLFAFSHQFTQGAELLANPVFKLYWQALYVIVFGLFVVMRGVRPALMWIRYRFKVERVERITPNAVNVYIGGRGLDRLGYHGGQFAIWRFVNKRFGLQAHPFTISIEPGGTLLRISVKGVGDFSKQIDRIEVGTPVILDGPFGVFTARQRQRDKVLLIAGGSGITPLRAMLPELLKQAKQVTLIYGNQTESETMLRMELNDLAANNRNFNWVNVLSNDSNAKGEHGFINVELIKRLVGDYAERDIFLCGPPAMMTAVSAELLKLGVPASRIESERFALAA